MGMIFKKYNFSLLVLILASALIFSGCKKYQGDIHIPAYIHLDAFEIVPQATSAPSTEAGFYTHSIDAVELVCYFEGDTAETIIGTYQLPCTVPLLRHGTMKYITATPCIKQNGIAATRIAYPYYQAVRYEAVRVAADSITNLGVQAADGRWVITTHYYDKSRIDILCEDYFEPTAFATHFDQTLEWVKDAPSDACTGQGYGRIYINDTTTTLTVNINEEFSPEETQYLYLEMDYRNDVEMEIGMLGFPTLSSSQVQAMSVIRLYPTDEWTKIYINLGRTWSQFNYNTPIQLYFDAVNANGQGGYVRIDNVKLLAI